MLSYSLLFFFHKSKEKLVLVAFYYRSSFYFTRSLSLSLSLIPQSKCWIVTIRLCSNSSFFFVSLLLSFLVDPLIEGTFVIMYETAIKGGRSTSNTNVNNIGRQIGRRQRRQPE